MAKLPRPSNSKDVRNKPSKLARLPFNGSRSRRGVALILALSVFAIVSGIAVSVLSAVQREVRLVERVQASAEWQSQLLGGEAWAMSWLNELTADSMKTLAIDHEKPWQLVSTTFPLEQEGDLLEIHVIDRQTCIDINGLADEAQQPITQKWLMALSDQLGVDKDWVYWVTDWLDSDQHLSAGQGREDEYYQGAEVPYRTSDTPMLALSEWVLLQVDAKDSDTLAPYICSLPDSIGVNINRAPEVVWRSLIPDLPPEKQEALKAKLDTSGFASVDDFTKDDIFADVELEVSDWRVDTRFVEVFVTLTQNNKPYYLHSALYKDEGGQVSPYFRAFGDFDTITRSLTGSANP